MSQSSGDFANDALDPVKIRDDVAPAAELRDHQRQRALRMLQAGLAGSLTLGLVCLLTPVFRPLDLRPKDLSSINGDSVIFFTDPPGAKVSTESLNSQGNALGASGQDPIPRLQITRDPRTGEEKDNVLVFFNLPGYAPTRQAVTPLELTGKIWPTSTQPPLRLTPVSPWVYVTDYMRRFRPWLFGGLCLSAFLTLALGLALGLRYRWLAARERVRRNERARDNLTGLSVLGYEIVERLGSGATSLVYRGFSERDFQTERAVRFSRMAQVSSQDTDTFRREVGVYQKIDHPNVVKAYDFQRFDNTFVIVMELIEGQSMENLFGEGRPLPVEKALPVFTSIAAGLDHAHARGVVHRDLKPANVMIRRDGSPVVVDFGMATDLNVTKITQTGIIKGTLAYIAPEQIANPNAIGPPTDQFAFGIMLYEALSGKLAYQAEDPSRLIMDRMNGQAIPFGEAAPDFPEDVAASIMRMIAADPQQRFPTIGEGMEILSKTLKKECKS